MAKSWKSFVKPQATPADTGAAAPAPNWQELAQQNETLRQLLQERSQLEQQMQQLAGQPPADAPPDRYEIPSFGQRKKNDAQWQQQKEEQKKLAQQKEANRREAMRAWEAKKAAQVQKTQLARKVIAPAPQPTAKPKPIVAAANALQKWKANKKQSTESNKPKPAKVAKALERARDFKKQVSSGSGLKDTWEQLKALKQQKRAEQPTKPSALSTAFEKLRNKPQVNELRNGIKKVKERSPKERVERLKQKAEPFKQIGKQVQKLELVRPKMQVLQKAKENLKLDEKREQVLEKLRLKKKLEAQWEQGSQKIEDLMALKADAEKKWKEFKEMEAGEKGFDEDADPKEPSTDAKAEEKRQAEKEEQRRQQREEERRQQRQEQRREERRSERKKDKYS
jgi:hypothetical protein